MAPQACVILPEPQHWRPCNHLVPLTTSLFFPERYVLCPAAWPHCLGTLHTRVLAEHARLNQQAEWNWPHSWGFGFSPLKFMETAKALEYYAYFSLLPITRQRISSILTTKWQELKNGVCDGCWPNRLCKESHCEFSLKCQSTTWNSLLHYVTCCHKEFRVCKKQQ